MNDAVDRFAAWFLNAPEAAQTAAVAAAIAFLSMTAALTSALIARRQAITNRQALFASLWERRVEWLDGFRASVRARNKEISEIPPAVNAFTEQRRKAPLALFDVSDAARMAHWLFDGVVAGYAAKTAALLDQKTELIILARSDAGRRGMEAAQEVGAVAWEVEQTLDALVNAIKPFMYVGDVKNPSRAARAKPRLKSVRRAGGERRRD